LTPKDTLTLKIPIPSTRKKGITNGLGLIASRLSIPPPGMPHLCLELRMAGGADAHEIVRVKGKVGMGGKALDVVHLLCCGSVVLVNLKRIFAEWERGELRCSHLLPTRGLAD
jgi:hypothetical protein